MLIKEIYSMTVKLSNKNSISDAVKDLDLSLKDEEGKSFLDHVLTQNKSELLEYIFENRLISFMKGSIYEGDKEYDNIDKLFDLINSNHHLNITKYVKKNDYDAIITIYREKAKRNSTSWKSFKDYIDKILKGVGREYLLTERTLALLLEKKEYRLLYKILIDEDKVKDLKHVISDKLIADISKMWQDIKIGATLKNPKYFEEVSLTEAFNNKQYEIINAYIEFKDIKYADEIKEFKNNRYLDYNFDLIELLMNYGIYVARTEGREETLIDSQYQSNVLKILHKRIK